MKKTLVLLTTLLLTAAICTGQTCTNGKVYSECGTMCPQTCDNKDSPPVPCPLVCKTGCVCPSGMVEYNDGCVAPEECPTQPVCTNGNVFKTCGSACPVTCQNMDNPPACIDECVEGCFCPNGMVSNEGTCVSAADCPIQPVCTNGNVFKTCGSACPVTCQNMDNPPACIDECVEGCFCPNGMVSNEGTCVSAADCPIQPVCTNGNVFKTCGSACPVTCQNMDNPPACIDECVEGCFCPNGMVSNEGTCVSAADCPTQPVCTNGNVFKTCGSACPVTCQNIDNPPAACIEECVEGCFCPNGMVSNEGTCVSAADCLISVAHCQLSPVAGLCKGSFSKFFYNSTSSKCESFVYGGCGGNDNKFDTKDSCMESCGDDAVPNFDNPFVTPPLSCPDDSSLLDACLITSECMNEGVGSSGDCEEDSLCCETGCGGLLCNKGVIPSPLCAAVKAKAMNESDGLLGAYIPQCEEDGSFSQTQCHEGMCWCVDTETGKAAGESVGPGTLLECTVSPTPQACTNGKVYSECGTMCPLTCDNKDSPPLICPLACKIGCICPSGMVEYNDGCVAPEECPDTTTKPAYCQLPPVGGLCEAYFPSFFYNSTSSKCESFVYGGCGGNDNRFDTKDSCMESCGDEVTTPEPVFVVEAVYNAQKLCPVANGDVCGDQCTADGDECEDWEKCCPNGCGHSCMDTVDIPYYSPPMQCPKPIVPICNFHFSCSSHEECDDGNYCCSTGCGALCMASIEPTPLCSTVSDSVQSSGLLGAYIPQCDENGNFTSLQCHGSTGMCWCVDTKTGKPLTTPVMAEQPDCDSILHEDDKCKGIQCDWPYCGEGVEPMMDDEHCCPYCPASCTVGDESYPSGTSFKSSDGCNTCNCFNGIAACTLMACIPVCRAGGIVLNEGETKSDGCTEYVCEGGKITSTIIDDGCTDPITRSVDVTMKFNGDFDIISQDLEAFKTSFKTGLVTRYQPLNLHESQITVHDVYQGSVVVTATIEDNTNDNTPNMANITLLIIQIEQDYNNKELTIQYQDATLEPIGDFSYEVNDHDDEEEEFFFGAYIIVSSILLVLVVALIITVIGVIVVMKRNRKTATRTRLPSKDEFEDYELDGKVKGFSNPTYAKATEAI